MHSSPCAPAPTPAVTTAIRLNAELLDTAQEALAHAYALVNMTFGRRRRQEKEMSNYCAPATRPKARKPHKCIACLAVIPAGEHHWNQTGFYEGSAFRHRFHDECWQALGDAGDDEFIPGDVEPPTRLQSQPNA